jgi:peroxiredoxin/YHS domain-containing protein
MKIVVACLRIAVVTLFINFEAVAQLPKEAVCAVCRIIENSAKPEKVVAASEYQGASYYFCSQKYKDEFDADPAAYIPPALPRPAPDFTLANLSGEKMALKDFRGKVVLLDFWATWCKPCVKSMPALQKLHDQLAPQGFTVLGISIDEDGEKNVGAFVKKHKTNYPILLDAEQNPAYEIYKVKAIPMMFLIDKKGQIVKQWIGVTALKEVETAAASLLVKNE